MFSGRIIFISPLDWGLGHASRCVPLIRELLKNNRVIIGVTARNAFFFEAYFPSLQKVELPSYNISYSKHLPLWLKLVLQWQRIKRAIALEKKMLRQIVTDLKIDLVISDNRFGLSHPEIHSVFVSHQLALKTPFFTGIAGRVNRKYIHRFNEVWVPDYDDRRLSGDLSLGDQIRIPVKYIGPQSALEPLQDKENKPTERDYLILLSGPEPQRTLLEEALLKVFEGSGKKITLVRGTNRGGEIRTKMEVIGFASGEELRDLIVSSGTVICRSGYSSLMDLHILGKTDMVLIPTPGQTEQKYLAGLWHQNFGSRTLKQKDLKRFFQNSFTP